MIYVTTKFEQKGYNKTLEKALLGKTDFTATSPLVVKFYVYEDGVEYTGACGKDCLFGGVTQGLVVQKGDKIFYKIFDHCAIHHSSADDPDLTLLFHKINFCCDIVSIYAEVVRGVPAEGKCMLRQFAKA